MAQWLTAVPVQSLDGVTPDSTVFRQTCRRRRTPVSLSHQGTKAYQTAADT